MTRYTMPARSQGKLYTQRETARLERDGVHRWVFANGLAPGVEYAVRKWLLQRLDGFYCDLQAAYTPNPATQAWTHIVIDYTPSLPSMAPGDEAVELDACGLNALDAAKALIKATGLNPHMSVCGWPFCLDDLDDTGGVR